MRSTHILLLACSLFIFLTSCDSTREDSQNETNVPTTSDKVPDHLEAEKFIMELDVAELAGGKSLWYSKPDGSSIEVEYFVNDSSEVVKMIEYTTPGNGGSIQTRFYYYKDGAKFATKEYYEIGSGENAVFAERVSYYDEKGKPKVSKQRTAVFEDELGNESFILIDKYNCSDEKCLEVLQRKGEYATTFQGFVQDQHLLYLIVGEDKKDGYTSSLVVQIQGPTIRELKANESSMLGTPLDVEFETTVGDQGYKFQALLSIEKL